MSYYFINNHPVIEKGILKKIDVSKLIVIPEGVKTIMGEKLKTDIGISIYGDDIFYSGLNNKLEINQVVLPDDGVKIIGEKAFEHDHNLSDINLPDGLKEIRLSAFLCCYNLKTIYLPKSITLLDSWCFYLIDNLIINYDGTTSDWKKVKKGTDWANSGTLINTRDGEIVL